VPIRNDIRSIALPLLMAIAVAAVVVPTCQMVGCDMSGGAMPYFGHITGTAISAPCGGTTVTNQSPPGIVPSTADSLTLALSVAVLGVMALVVSPQTEESALVEVIEPPPPPDDANGERLRI